MRKIGLQLVMLAAVLIGGPVHALGLGEIEVKSRLNQSLVAVVPINASSVDELQSVSVALASLDDFERAGIERIDFLSQLQFNLRGDLIEITSREPAREPFISFLLEVRTNSGRLLREYTVLLDPPGFSSAVSEPAPAPIAKKSAEPAPVFVAEEAAAAPPAVEASTTSAPVPDVKHVKPSVPPVSKKPAAPVTVPSQPQSASASASSYGPVEGKETLWSIAYKLRPDAGISMSQMQVAIFDANRSAFDGNLSGLRKGSILKIPSRESVAAINPDIAKKRISSAKAAPPSPKEPPPVVESSPPVAPAAVEKPAPAVAEKPAAVAPPEKQVPAAPAPKPAAVVEKSTPTSSAVDAESVKPAPAPAAAATATPVLAPAAEDESTPATEESASPEAAPTAEAMYDEVPADGTVTTPAPELESNTEAVAEPAIATAPLPESVPAEVASSESGLFGNPLLLPALAMVVLLGGAAVGVKAWKQRAGQRQEPQVAESPEPHLVNPSEFVEPVVSVPFETKASSLREDAVTSARPLQATVGIASQKLASPVSAARTQAPSSAKSAASTPMQAVAHEAPKARSAAAPAKPDFDLTSQFAAETVQINLDSNDPIAEADFHLAYGLYDEASLLLQQAAKKDPKRVEIRAKLAEVYFAAGQADNFRKVAEGLRSQLPEAQWQKLAIMGQQLCPDAAIFKGVSAAAMASEVDLSFDEPAETAVAPASEPAPLEFNLEELQLPETAAAPAPTPTTAAADNTLQFDLGDLKFDIPDSTSSATDATVKLEDLKLDQFDAGEIKLEATPKASAARAEVDLNAALDTPIEEMPTGDESATKLDLARAYIDMGDSDMAKGLLLEVADQGNAQQKSEAQELLRKLAA